MIQQVVYQGLSHNTEVVTIIVCAEVELAAEFRPWRTAVTANT